MNTFILSIVLECLAFNCLPGHDASAALGSPRFNVRQKAARALERGWPASDATLQKTSLSSDIEAAEQASAIRRRCLARALDQAGPAPWADWQLMRPDFTGWDDARFPWLNQRIRARLKEAGARVADPEELWPEYREVSRLWAEQALDAGIPPTLIRIWFAAGRAVDDEYLHRRKLTQLQPMPTGFQYEWNK